MRKLKIIVLLLIITINANAYNNWYVDSTANAGTANGSFANPWKTLAQLQTAGNGGVIAEFDTVNFKRGYTYISANSWGGFRWWHTAGYTCPSNVYFRGYGTGSNPNFLFPYPSAVPAGDRIVWSLEGVDNITIDGIDFIDYRFPAGEKVIPGYTSECILLGERGSATDVTNSIILNCKFRRVGLAIVIGGRDNIVTQCDIDSLSNVISTPASTSPTEDYGANGITVSGNHNFIVWNSIKGCWASSLDFVWNGGALEFYGQCDSNQVLYNTITDCGGIGEFGAQGSAGTATAKDNLIAYNRITNCGAMSYVNYNSTFAITASNIQYFNNVIIENVQSRFTGPNTGNGVPDGETRNGVAHPASGAYDQWLFQWGSSSPAANIFTVKNNIIMLSTGLKIAINSSKITHDHNIIKLAGSSTPGYTLTGSEISTGTQIFVNEFGSDATLYNVHLVDGSLAENAGINVGITTDADSQSVSNPPDCGMFEKSGDVTPPQDLPGPHTYILANPGLQYYILKLHSP